MKLHPLYIGILSAGFTAATSIGVQADDSAEKSSVNTIETVLVSGSRIANSSPAQAIVLDSEAIKLRNSANAVELLRNLPGVDVIQPGGPGGITELFIRGAESNFTVVTIDGVRVNDTTNSRGGSFDLSALNPDDIERLEILKGPLSALYGSDALAGSLNIITKKPSPDTRISMRAEVGSDGYKRAYTSLSGGNSDGLAANISVAHLDGGEPVEGSTSVTNSVRSGLDWSVNDSRRIDASISYVDRERSSFPSGGGGSLYAPLDDLETSTAEDTSAQLGWREQINERLMFDLRGNYFKRDEDINTPMIPEGIYSGVPAMISDSSMERSDIVAHAVYTFTPEFTLAVGGEYKDESGRSDSVIDYGFPLPSSFDLNRTTRAVFAEMHYQVEDGIDFFVSTRFDKTEDYDAESSSKILLSYPINAWGTRIGASWGDAFKLPSFYAVGDSLVGNPDLLPEASETTEIFILQSLLDDRLRISATGFQSTYDQLIDFDFATFKLVNRADIEVDGVELEVVVSPATGFEMGVHATHTDYDTTLNGRPDLRGGLYAEWSVTPTWSGRLHMIYVGERASASTETGDVTLDSYQKVDAVLVKSLGKYFDISLSLDNLFDEDYQEEAGFPSPGRGIRVGASAKF